MNDEEIEIPEEEFLQPYKVLTFCELEKYLFRQFSPLERAIRDINNAQASMYKHYKGDLPKDKEFPVELEVIKLYEILEQQIRKACAGSDVEIVRFATNENGKPIVVLKY